MHISPTILKFKRPCVYLVVIIYLAFSVLLITHNFSSEYVQVKRNEPYREVVEDIKIFLDPKLLKLENLMDEDENLKSGKKQNIFFIETHMDGTRIIENARHACTIESAGLGNIVNLFTKFDHLIFIVQMFYSQSQSRCQYLLYSADK